MLKVGSQSCRVIEFRELGQDSDSIECNGVQNAGFIIIVWMGKDE